MIELRTADYARFYEVDLCDPRRMERENALDAHAVRYLADSDGLVESRTPAGDYNALEMLNTLFIALDDADGDVNDVPGPKWGNILTNLCKVDGVNDLFHVGRGVRCSECRIIE